MSRVHRKQQEYLQVQAATEIPEVARAVLPPGLDLMLKHKVSLQAQLQKHSKTPVIVSVDLFQENWVFVVRGWQQSWKLLTEWIGHEVLYKRAHSIGESHAN